MNLFRSLVGRGVSNEARDVSEAREANDDVSDARDVSEAREANGDVSEANGEACESDSEVTTTQFDSPLSSSNGEFLGHKMVVEYHRMLVSVIASSDVYNRPVNEQRVAKLVESQKGNPNPLFFGVIEVVEGSDHIPYTVNGSHRALALKRIMMSSLDSSNTPRIDPIVDIKLYRFPSLDLSTEKGQECIDALVLCVNDTLPYGKTDQHEFAKAVYKQLIKRPEMRRGISDVSKETRTNRPFISGKELIDLIAKTVKPAHLSRESFTIDRFVSRIIALNNLLLLCTKEELLTRVKEGVKDEKGAIKGGNLASLKKAQDMKFMLNLVDTKLPPEKWVIDVLNEMTRGD